MLEHIWLKKLVRDPSRRVRAKILTNRGERLVMQSDYLASGARGGTHRIRFEIS